ncbi:MULTISPECIES: hypothetical protein [Rossellomorea]|jgi:capsular polysaccharide biosynthesis protein|nr:MULTISPECIES: hypothetical protein [Rossellomorea]PRX79413.1 hypothetical protein B0G93_101159 [Bacillus sp. V-88]MCA0150069.1 hypothetical protein [Rossellomorea vietnamensis]MCC5803230.1 hypothetical protein [Rossellomorea vietnamensis]UTE78156.1 hypothetical protein M1J35_05155 [Rossellomorea sp. KS-H15a]WGG46114.1 hypothetical protein P8596_02515 [Rossellomorea sp. DA94]
MMGITITIGFIAILGIIMGILIYFLRQALDSNDSKKVDSRDDHFSQ